MPGPSACRTSRARNAEVCCPALDSEHGSRRPGTTGRSVPGGDGANPSTRSTPRTVPTRQRHRFNNSLQAGRLFLGQGFNTRWQPQRRGCSIGRAVAMAEPSASKTMPKNSGRRCTRSAESGMHQAKLGVLTDSVWPDAPKALIAQAPSGHQPWPTSVVVPRGLRSRVEANVRT